MAALLPELLNDLASGRLPRGQIPPDLACGEELGRLVEYLKAIQHFSLALANGDLSAPLPAVAGPVAGGLKSLHASLKHLTWQAQQIAAGDFSQRVDFLGEFSRSFNTMVEQLDTSRSTLEAVNRELEEKYVRLRELTDALQESEERFRLIAENVNDVIWTLDSSMERFTYISPSIAQLRGFCFDEAVLEPLERAFTPQSLELLRSQLAKSVAAARESSGRISEVIEVDQICREGEVIHLEVVVSAITDSAGRLKEFVGISRDISARKKREARLKYESTHDALTGLYNRAFYEEELERVAGGDRFPVSVVVGDLDGLKLVNDTGGHEAGDQLIKGAANVLRMAFRENDVITRTGGDEFVVILPGVGLESAQGALLRVRNCMQSYNKNSDGLPVSLSLGVAAASSGDEIPLAVRTADELMYADKVRRKQQRTS